jgi:hypothetical protein
MAQMQALLKIKADVEGEGKVNALGRSLGGLTSTAGKVSGGLKGLAGAAGGLGGALGALVPLATGAGLITLAKNSMDNAAKMFDLSQKTGVSVEALSRFSKAAKVSGTDVEGVTKAMIKLSKGLVEAKNGQGQAGEALKSMGISAVDANGKLKNTDQIMLEISNKFKAMPNGAEKTAIALQLFGRAGADMIPMLNMGGEAIGKLGAMTTQYAKDAKAGEVAMVTLQGKVGMLGGKLAVVLLPSITAITESLVRLLDGFNALPGPIQGLIVGVGLLAISFVALAPAITALASIGPVLAGLKIGAIIAGWAGAIGPAIAAISAAFTGLLTFLTGTLLPGLIAFFSGPVGWTVLAVAAVVAMAILFRKPLQDFAGWLVSWGKPISQFFTDYITTPISKAWQSMVDFLPEALDVAATTIKSVFTGVGTAIKAVLNGVLRGVFGAVNGAIENINRLIRAANAIAAKVRGPQFDQLPTLNIPQFAKGGYVGQGTLAVVGEAGPEYIVPERKAAAFAMNYLNGARGGAAIPAFANGGFVGGGSASGGFVGGSASGGFVGGNAQINVTTGPVMQQGGQQWATMADLEKVARATADGIYASLRTPAGRYATGVR